MVSTGKPGSSSQLPWKQGLVETDFKKSKCPAGEDGVAGYQRALVTAYLLWILEFADW